MANEITITAEQVGKMLELHADAERRLERAVFDCSDHEQEYRAECLAIERMLYIMGIEWC